MVQTPSWSALDRADWYSEGPLLIRNEATHSGSSDNELEWLMLDQRLAYLWQHVRPQEWYHPPCRRWRYHPDEYLFSNIVPLCKVAWLTVVPASWLELDWQLGWQLRPVQPSNPPIGFSLFFSWKLIGDSPFRPFTVKPSSFEQLGHWPWWRSIDIVGKILSKLSYFW